MKNKLFLIPVVALAIFCSCNNGTKYNPGATDAEQMSDSEREKKIAEAKAAYNAAENLFEYQGKIKLNVMTPTGDGIPSSIKSKIEAKMVQIVTANGIGGLGGDPRYVLAPVTELRKKDVTSTAPVRHLVEYDVTFYVADIITGTVFASQEMTLKGVGDSDELASIAAFNDINVKDSRLQKMLQTAEEKIIAYYTEHAEEFISQAEMLIAKQDYGQAMAVLGSIPVEAGQTYTKAVQMMATITPKYLAKESNLAFSQLKAALVKGDESDVKEAMFYYSQISEDSPCKKQADALINEYKVDVAKAKADKAESERMQAELQAKIQISANKCLLDKYKKDAAYDRLPWLRKVVYLGDYDPFDGYTPEEGC